MRRLDDSLPRRLWRAGRGVRGKREPELRTAVSIIPIGSRSGLEGLLLRLALAGSAGCLKNALLSRRLGCYVADCA